MKLFVSLSAAIAAILEGSLDLQTLETSLFFFTAYSAPQAHDADACVRRHAATEGSDRQLTVRAAHQVLMTALDQAETQGRVAWTNWPERSRYEDLSQLLTRNGQEPPLPMAEAQQDTWDPTHAEVQRVCPHIEVVYHRQPQSPAPKAARKPAS